MRRLKDHEAAIKAGIVSDTARDLDLQVKVGPHEFWVHASDAVAPSGNAGFCSPDTQEIFIDPRLGPSVTAETVLHELLHAVIHQTQLEVMLTDEQQEAVCWNLAPRIQELLLDNPNVMELMGLPMLKRKK